MNAAKIATASLTSRERTILFICVALGAAYLSSRFIFMPLMEHIKELSAQIELSEKRLKKNLRILRKAQAVGEAFNKYVGDFKQKASDEQQMTMLLSEIESAASNLGLGVADMKPKKVKKASFYNQFSVSLTLDGELEAVTHFLYALQNSPYFFDVDEFFFEKSSIRTTQIKCRLVVSKDLIF